MWPRLFATLTAALLAATTAAQPPTAPPPHLALDEFAREYQRLGLPLPPPGAELVRVKDSSGSYRLGFALPPEPDKPPYRLVGLKEEWAASVERVGPGSDPLRGVEPKWVADLLCTAAQARLRGLDQAAAVYARGLEATARPVAPAWAESPGLRGGTYKYRANGWLLSNDGDDRSALGELRKSAFDYWAPKLHDPDVDRHELLLRLRAAAPGGHPLVRALELTVAPRTSRPGTPEALIDDLTEYRSWPRYQFKSPPDAPHPGEAVYWKLVDLGFDAVPALLDHVNDPRFTRHAELVNQVALFNGFGTADTRQRTVGDLVRLVLADLAGDAIEYEPRGWEAGARRWWEKARPLGEEEWLVRRARPPAPREGVEDARWAEGWPPHPNVLRVLGRRYPARLGEIYRHVLTTRPGLGSRDLADAVAASNLPAAAKVRLLGEGASHRRLVHRKAALAALADADPAAFHRHLVATVGQLPPDVTELEWESPLMNLVPLFRRATDRACWDALAAAARRDGARGRFDVLWHYRLELLKDRHLYPMEYERATRRERLRFLLGFLGDTSVHPDDDFSAVEAVAEERAEAGDAETGPQGYTGWLAYRFLEVRDYAAVLLAEELGWDIGAKAGRGEEARRVIREAVREAAGRGLATSR